MSFIRRFGFFPGVESITAIEGVIIVDLPPPGAIQGVGVGTTGIVGEFLDVTSAVHVDASGNVTTKPKPVEIFSGQDMISKLGGFDSSIGDFGNSGGNGFVALRNKKFSRLIACAVNFASALGTRLWRELPPNTGATSPVPLVPMQAATVLAGREFRNGANRVRTAKVISFSDDNAYLTGVDGVVTPVGLPAATQVFNSPGANFLNAGVAVDDALVLSHIVPAATLASNLPAITTTLSDSVPAASTTLTAPMAPGDLTANVIATAGYAATGTLQIDNELMDYAGTTPTSFTGLTRGAHGTTAAAHGPLASVVEQLPVATTTGYATSGTVQIGTEFIDYTGVTPFLFTGLTRGAHGSTAAAHVATDPVEEQVLLVSAAGLSSPTGTILIGSEEISYTSIDGNLLLGVTRAANGTVQAAHLAGASVTQENDAGTFRVVSVVDANNLTIEHQDGSNFTATTWLALSALPWRLHLARTADTGLNFSLAGTGGYIVPARPLDAAVPQATNLPPTIAPPAVTATSWDVLSGLTLRTHPTAPGLAFDASVQGPNAPAGSALDALYVASIDAYEGQDLPERDVNILFSARTSDNIRSALKQHALASSSVGVGRIVVISPPLSTQDTSTATGDTSPGVGATRNERVIYSWPGARTFVPEAVNTSIAVASGSPTVDGILDVPGDGWLSAVMSNLPPERNPGQAGPPVPEILAPIVGIQRGVTGLTVNDYIVMRQRGVAGLIIDRSFGPQFQSGITSSLVNGEKNINRRRMADFIEDSIAQALVQFTKLPLTQSLKDAIEAQANAFLTTLLSPNNPPAQRINDFIVDPRSGNTPDLSAQGIFVLIVRVQTTPTADFIVGQFEIGEGVVIQR